ncbi:capsular polysaccharide synthesis protein [Bifidobacterium crudilactis]|jgi:hypothetical protein|uniref:capsular polysaccharide synthesis protein n=1 Tax=Bifidobacterium crudilactis TaxID=327277 RepID=UPI000AC22577|nr:capsular polysaccharide synthesis protein [Bifidobacterium crudilactis]MCI2149112.1 capsular polysaccharide synthesis protein [Bifidobacterium crudilactis]MCI2157623.1 capsular polysaccharide synthesis protein [Bifidobacterium crudilactis]
MITAIRQKAHNLYYHSRQVSLWFYLLGRVTRVDRYAHKITNTYCRHRIHRYRDGLFQRFLRREFGPFVDQWKDLEETAVPFADPSTAPIWMFWLQGEKNAPPLIAALIANTKAHAGTHPVHVVSLDTINQYVEIDPQILKLYKQHKIGANVVANMLRFALLEEYGGCWLDATMLLTAPLPDEIFTRPFWNATGLNPATFFVPFCVDITVWESYFMAAQPHALLFKFLKAIYTEYFNRYDMVLEYLLINHFAKIAREDIPTISKEFNQLPPNNTECEMLRPRLIRAPSTEYRNILDALPADTYLFKLSHTEGDPYSRGNNVDALIQAIQELFTDTAIAKNSAH